MLVVAMQGHISPWFFEMDRVAFEKEGLIVWNEKPRSMKRM